MKKTYWIILAVVALLLIVVAIVVWKDNKRSPLIVDVSDIDVQVNVERFDVDLFDNYDSNVDRLNILKIKYGDFFDLFNQYIIKIGPCDIDTYNNALEIFLSDYTVLESKHAVDSLYGNLDNINEELTDAFKHYKYYFPNEDVPRIIAFIAGFNHSIVTTNEFIGIGLDKYLGLGNHLYNLMQIPEFAQFEMRPECIPYDCVKAWAEMKFPYVDSSENLMRKMVYEGKIMYFVDAMFPKNDNAEKMSYSLYDIDYCENHERDMWGFIVENKLLFSTDFVKIKNFTESAPFTKDFGNDSPPRIGIWLGWQIVKSYMENNDVSVLELMQNNNYQQILNLSQYDP